MASSYTINSAFKLNSGYEIPLLGFGVYLTPPEETERAVADALKAGYRHIDSAVFYHNEEGCGKAIKASGLPRSEIYFTSKIPPDLMSYDATKAQVDKSLKTAGLDYIDLILIHSPYGGSAARKGVWKALVEAVEEGKVRSIGVSNYGVQHLDELEKHIAELEAERGGKGKGGVISVGQWEIHPWCRREDIAEWSKKRNIAVEAYCPVVRGERFGDPTLVSLAEKYGKTQAQILIRWSLQKGYLPLPKSATTSRIIENAAIYDFDLSQEDIEKLNTDVYAPIAWDPTKAGLDD
ncbi:putative oxidoreductase C2F3.05c [Daldinia childiae]|uniref:putative oxidoreductase C2F3.05c n=1 Tax=Daldinia childiae TaxID=326645 RepID=UPI00144661FA|nr:putative oxidoreductase C2F3.05c [Daldinia childiae]KAF3065828.1 putative oxidoreductase C2F3.05c [Daldinia childiae]